jgi:hypothetical protein
VWACLKRRAFAWPEVWGMESRNFSLFVRAASTIPFQG